MSAHCWSNNFRLLPRSIFEGAGVELRKPFARFAEFVFAAQLIQVQDELYIIVSSLLVHRFQCIRRRT